MSNGSEALLDNEGLCILEETLETVKTSKMEKSMKSLIVE